LSDSVTHVLVAQHKSGQEILDATRAFKGSRIMDFTIYKNYPQKGKLTLCDYFGFDRNMYEEAMLVFHWTLSKDTLTVCSYLCKKATTTFICNRKSLGGNSG
jgi:GLPGLI family protein